VQDKEYSASGLADNEKLRTAVAVDAFPVNPVK
jgi:hypothetical protein